MRVKQNLYKKENEYTVVYFIAEGNINDLCLIVFKPQMRDFRKRTFPPRLHDHI